MKAAVVEFYATATALLALRWSRCRKAAWGLVLRLDRACFESVMEYSGRIPDDDL